MDKEFHLAKSDNTHIDKRFDEILAEFKKLEGAFAKDTDGEVDFDGHRRYHEDMIRAANAQEQFWRELRLEIAKKGLWTLLIIICGLIFAGLSIKLGFSKVGG